MKAMNVLAVPVDLIGLDQIHEYQAVIDLLKQRGGAPQRTRVGCPRVRLVDAHPRKQIGDLAQTTNGVLANDIKPTIANLNKAVSSAQRSMETLDSAIGDARPGLQSFSKQTIPEMGQLIHDLREMAASLSSVAEKIDRGGAGSIVGSPKLPDYKGK